MASAIDRRLLISLALVLALIFVTACGLAMSTADGGDERSGEPIAIDPSAPTYYADVQPILEGNCVSCHRQAQATDFDDGSGFYAADLVAPMGLASYEETRAWAPAIASAVQERTMPPWGASVEFKGKFFNERYLEDEEIETLIAWSRAGAPAGDPPEASSKGGVDVDPTQWAISDPDLEIRFDEPYLVDDEVEDLYVDIHVKLSEDQRPERRWIKAAELRAGSNVVHHINTQYLGTITPGRENVYRWPEGFAMFLPDTATVLFDMHYHKNPGPGTATYDRTGGAMAFYEDGEVIDYLVETFPLLDGSGAPGATASTDVFVPAGAKNHEFTATQLFEEDTYLLSVAPHMHLRGKAARLEIEYPDGRKELLLDVPNYNFRWQHKYDFREPVFMPGGSVLHLTGVWDNSADNSSNPDPTESASWGLPSTSEMLTGRFIFAKAERLGYVVGSGEPIPERALEDARRYQRRVARSVSGEPTSLVTADGVVDLESENPRSEVSGARSNRE